MLSLFPSQYMRQIRERLKHYSAKKVPLERLMRRASVAAILRDEEGLKVLLIKRAEREGDPWSGHMAFPGGHRDPEDASDEATAIRETLEEIGLDLIKDGASLGILSQLLSKSKRGLRPMVVSPFIFELPKLPPLKLNEEAQLVVWVPLAFLAKKENRQSMSYPVKGTTLTVPCYHFEGHKIWGLTLRMLDELVARLSEPPSALK